jgi:hypothetical protein
MVTLRVLLLQRLVFPVASLQTARVRCVCGEYQGSCCSGLGALAGLALHLRPPDLLIQSGDFVPPLRGSLVSLPTQALRLRSG